MIFKEFAPNKIKKILTGSGHADKLQMIHMIKLVVKNVAASITNDEADALAVAYAVSIEV
jgi:crossover junction endodeoxyribonuclease RuvC